MTNHHGKPDYDVIIIGARCAGAATARMLALAGARVLVVERAKLGADTLSTSYLMRAAVMQLQRWNILPALIAAGTPPVRTTHFHYAQHSVAVDVRPAPGFDALYAPRRTVLDPLLVAAASGAGAELQFGSTLSGLLRRDDGRVCGVELTGAASDTRRQRISAELVIGADGLRSTFARSVEAACYRVGRHAGATIYGYFAGLALDAYHWYYAHGLAAGAAPTNDGLCTVFVGAPAVRLPELRGDRQQGLLRVASALSPSFGELLRDARRVGALRGFAGMPGFYRQPFGPGWALVGDAGYYRDPTTAHGISDALRDSESLVRALCIGGEQALRHHQQTRDAASARLFEATDEIAGGVWDEARIEELLRAASEGMRDGVRVVEGFARDQLDSKSKSACQSDSSGTPFSRLELRTASRSGL